MLSGSQSLVNFCYIFLFTTFSKNKALLDVTIQPLPAHSPFPPVLISDSVFCLSSPHSFCFTFLITIEGSGFLPLKKSLPMTFSFQVPYNSLPSLLQAFTQGTSSQ